MTALINGGDRADARRNRAKMLTAAGEAFATDGLEVPLGEIARRAGVGAGTVYRHFPTKQALLEAVFVQHLDGLVATGERLMAQLPPTHALFEFLDEVIEKTDKRGHLCDVVAGDASWPHPMLTASVQRFRQMLTALLHAAQRSGGVRPDLDPDDVVSLTVGCAAILRARRDRASGLSLVRLVLDSLRPTVTEQAFRDDRCGECGATLPLRSTGRPARYCGATCRQRARRRRLTG